MIKMDPTFVKTRRKFDQTGLDTMLKVWLISCLEEKGKNQKNQATTGRESVAPGIGAAPVITDLILSTATGIILFFHSMSVCLSPN